MTKFQQKTQENDKFSTKMVQVEKNNIYLGLRGS
jgi:hypothetical protein